MQGPLSVRQALAIEGAAVHPGLVCGYAPVIEDGRACRVSEARIAVAGLAHVLSEVKHDGRAADERGDGHARHAHARVAGEGRARDALLVVIFEKVQHVIGDGRDARVRDASLLARS